VWIGCVVRTGKQAPGRVLVVAGPDGSGKSTLVDAVCREALASYRVMRLHHRPGVLPVLTGARGPVTEPHRRPPYPAPLSFAKTLYLYADFLLGWTLRIRPWVRRGRWVILERGWWDVVVDPRRYRLREPARVAAFLGRFLPDADLTVVLEGHESLLLARKRELPQQELLRQREAWRQIIAATPRHLYLDASRPESELASLVGNHLLGPLKADPTG
jgi:thymidylate kinase